jgi:hypothetical protein
MNYRSVTALLLPALLAACTERNTPEPGTGVGAGPLPTELPDGDTAFTWRRAGGETTDFGGNDQPTCQEDSASPITRQQAIELGFALDPALPTLDGVSQAELMWSEGACSATSTCPHTSVTISARLESLVLHALSPVPDVLVNADDCQDYLAYASSVELSTADGSIAGSFAITGNARLGDPDGTWSASGTPALTDLRGTRHLSLDAGRPHWSEVVFGLPIGQRVGGLDATVIYTDGKAPAEQGAMFARWSNAGEVIDFGDRVPSGPDSIALDDYHGSSLPPTFEVEALPFFEQPGARLSVSINGEVRTFDDIPEGEALLLGKLRIGDVVSAEVTNDRGGWVDSALRVGGCFQPVGRCRTLGCSARAEVTVAAMRCDPNVLD